MPVKYSPIRKDKLLELTAKAQEVKHWPLEDKIWHLAYNTDNLDDTGSIKEYVLAIWKGRKDKINPDTGLPRTEAITDMAIAFSKLRKSLGNTWMILRPFTNEHNQIVYRVIILKGKYQDTKKKTSNRILDLQTTEKKEEDVLSHSPKKLTQLLELEYQKKRLKHSRRSRRRGDDDNGGAGIN